MRREGWSRSVLLLTYSLAVVFIPLGDALARSWLKRLGWWGMPVAVVGVGTDTSKLVERLRQNDDLGFLPVATIEPSRLSSAGALAGRGVRTAIVALPQAGRAQILRLIRSLPFSKVIIVEDWDGLESLWVTARDLGGIIGLEIRKNLLERRNRILKRVMDYALGIPLFLLSVPVILLLAGIIMLVSPGTPFFLQEREGYGGKPIKVWKLRTMYPDAERRLERYLEQFPEAREEWNRYFKLKNDPRILPLIGHLLRKTSLDELPQLWNIVRGEMSLVGPRPFPYYHLESFNEEFRALRRSVLPGITGFWQISARSDGDVRQQEALDTYYIRNWSIWLDIYILARTVEVVLRRKGAY